MCLLIHTHLDGVFADIDELVATLTGRISPVAPATMVLLVGPREPVS